jgi:hypothetical protein
MEEHGPDDEGAMEGAAAPETPQFAPRTPQAGAAAPETPRAAPETPQFAPRTPPAQWPAPDTPTTVADDLSDADDDLPMMIVVRARRWTDEEGSEDDKWTDFVPGATAAVAAATAAAPSSSPKHSVELTELTGAGGAEARNRTREPQEMQARGDPASVPFSRFAGSPCEAKLNETLAVQDQPATARTAATATTIGSRSSVELAEDVADAVNRGAAQRLSAQEQVRRVCYVSGLSPQASGHVVAELFSPPRVNAKLHDMQDKDLTAGTSFDMIVDQCSGVSWDFLQADHRRRCWARLRSENPWVVIGSPPCTAFSVLNRGLNRDRVPVERRERQLTEAKVLLGFALSVYTWQVRRQRYFVHEHPASASSWDLPEVLAVRTMEGVTTVLNDA